MYAHELYTMHHAVCMYTVFIARKMTLFDIGNGSGGGGRAIQLGILQERKYKERLIF